MNKTESGISLNKHVTNDAFVTASDGCRLFTFCYQPINQYKAVIFIIAGITGINHQIEKDLIELLSDNVNRVMIIHPRGTGYSGGVRGDISTIHLFINDYREIIKKDEDYISKQHPVFLFGHSMACAVLLAVADGLSNIDGAILVNPPYIQKKAKGMSPGLGQYIKYAFFMLFAKHKPIVNMAGDPSTIEIEEDRKEAEQRINDALLVQHFSMYYMNSIRKLIRAMPANCKRADYPLLLIYGMKDAIVDKKGCDIIFSSWKHPEKKYLLVQDGTHGKSTVTKSAMEIQEWIRQTKKIQ